MKTLFRIIFLFVFYFLFFVKDSFSYEINDLWNIYKNINEIDWYKWNFSNNDLWFLWTKYLFISKDWKSIYWYFDENKRTVIKKIDIDFLSKLWFLGRDNSFSWNILDLSIVKWYFDENKRTVIKKIDIDFLLKLWFLGSDNSFTWNILDLNITKWYFDENRKTIIRKINPEYNFYLWYLWNVKINTIINWWNTNKVIKSESYKYILEEYIKLNTLTFAIENDIWLKDYNHFVYNILEIIFNWSEWKIFIGDDIEKFKKELNKTDFLDKIKLLIKNTKEINRWFKYLKTKKEKIYMLSYYLN